MMDCFHTRSLTSTKPLSFNPEWLDALFLQSQTVWVGFSGGVDSLVLLHCLVAQLSKKQREKLVALHVHHGLSDQADDWLQQCSEVCAALEVKFVAQRVQVASQASLEEAARNARYSAFYQLSKKDDVILLAHHAADQVETVLFRLLRGTGGRGLAGIPKQRRLGKDGALIMRPLLAASKQDITSYAQTHLLHWVEDESNNDEAFSRNFLRHRILPVLKERFPALEQNVISSAQRIGVDYEMLERFASQQLKSWVNESGGFELAHLLGMPLSERLFWWRYFLQNRGVSLSQSQLASVERMFSSSVDKQPEFTLLDGRLMRHQGKVYVLPHDREAKVGVLDIGVTLERDFDAVCVSGVINCELRQRPTGESLLMPNGKTRKLKKWLNDNGIPNWWRDHLPYLYVDDTLVAIGNLWQNPNYPHVYVEWHPKRILPLPIGNCS